MTTTFTTRGVENFASDVKLVPGKQYRLKNSPFGECVATFLYAKDQEKIMHEGHGRRVRIMIVEKHWELN